MPRRKQPRRTTVRDIRTILRLTHEQGLSVREVGLRLKLSKTTVATYLNRAREAGLNCWPLPSGRDDDATLKQVLFQRAGRPPQDLTEPDWPKMAAEMKRKGVTLVLLWEEYRAAHPDGYGYTWFCERYREFESRISPRYRNRHEAGAVMQTDYAGHTMPVIDPGTGAEHRAQIFVAVLGASNYTFAWASLTQKLPDWIEAQVRALKFFGGVPKAIVCDNLKAAVAKPLWFEPSLTKTFSDMATHYDTTVLPTRPRKPRDKGKVEGAVLIVERWILARLRNRQFFSIEALNVAIGELLDDLNARTMRRVGRSRRDLFKEIERRCQLNSLAPRKWPVLERQMLAAPFQASKASIRCSVLRLWNGGWRELRNGFGRQCGRLQTVATRPESEILACNALVFETVDGCFPPCCSSPCGNDVRDRMRLHVWPLRRIAACL